LDLDVDADAHPAGDIGILPEAAAGTDDRPRLQVTEMPDAGVGTNDDAIVNDVFVTCGDAARQGHEVKTDAVLIVEVLSPATAAFDRGMKFAHYRQLPGLQEYLLIDPATRTADLYRKGSDGL
jgi:Uma2 family endonuclease